MKNTLKYLSILFFVTAFVACDKDDDLESKDIKRYNVESGMVTYATAISGPYVNGSGTNQLYFDKWGALELKNELSSETVITYLPDGTEESTTKDAHNTYKIDNQKVYVVDYKEGYIITKDDPLIEYMRQNDLDALEAGKEMFENLGGVQLANEKVLGYDCEVWELLGIKQWIYKGLTLKVVTNMAGITIIEEATSIRFDIPVADNYFDLPDFPMKDINDL
ncbi:MAG: hypothetical protein JEZ01_00945 [Labilibaculum sp.]|nr:hypothetical protein [Labilibaculum sp.]MBI9056312.1 hypothetical protein [Labilibaculum sp.]